MFNIDKDTVAGPDGFSSLFYQHYWEIITIDLFEAVQDFFDDTSFPQEITSTTLVLLPKKKKWPSNGLILDQLVCVPS